MARLSVNDKKKKDSSRTRELGLVFGPSRFKKFISDHVNNQSRISSEAPIALSLVAEFLAGTLLKKINTFVDKGEDTSYHRRIDNLMIRSVLQQNETTFGGIFHSEKFKIRGVSPKISEESQIKAIEATGSFQRRKRVERRLVSRVKRLSEQQMQVMALLEQEKIKSLESRNRIAALKEKASKILALTDK